ncbi:Thymus-specific serine protease [Entomophthora muscae]|uniref:Thymus-specific serine protease n=1 Tax=Entomophthora muscae TaxID=34485 RepID=A0ACC2U4G6_9FUNG|nr:Thymus-specific serine protease [Entomophthora muscae]
MRFFFLVLGVFGIELFFDQKVDHFSPNTSTTFQQRYYVNDVYYKDGGPAFIYIGGESALEEHRTQNGLVADLAKEHQGVVYGLEHRYYGKSHPFPELTVQNLKYLSSEQALKDLVYFASRTSPRRPSKWFLIGGSYPGMLAAWGRQRYPHVFHGALASSAPVLAKADFYEYDEMVGYALGKKCQSSLNKVMVHLDKLYAQGKLEPFKRALSCSQVHNDKQFLFIVADVVADIVQYNKPTSPNITDLCTSVKPNASNEIRLLKFVKLLNSYFHTRKKTCHDYTRKIRSTKPIENRHRRQWIYQSCNEFGFWQTASKSPSRSKHLTAEWIESFYCGPSFFSPAIGPANTKLVNARNKGLNLNPSNIIFTHGENDPWSALSYKKTNSIVIPNGSHCNDLSTKIYNSKSFTPIRNKLKSTFRSWMNY